MKENSMTSSPEKPARSSNNWLAGGGLLGSTGAFIGASCCVLPLVLFNLGVSSALIAKLEFFAVYRDHFLFGALALIGASLLISLRRSKRPSRPVVIISIVGLTLVSAAYILPYYEQELLVLFGFRAG